MFLADTYLFGDLKFPLACNINTHNARDALEIGLVPVGTLFLAEGFTESHTSEHVCVHECDASV